MQTKELVYEMLDEVEKEYFINKNNKSLAQIIFEIKIKYMDKLISLN